jgi:hypothetical protein
MIAIKQLSNLWFLSLLFYIASYYILHELIQIRAGVAVGFLLLSIKSIYERNGKQFLFFSTCSVFFHYSGLLILPLWFLSPTSHKFIWFLFIPIAYLIYVIGIDISSYITMLVPIVAVQEKLIAYQNSNIFDNTINLFSMGRIMKISIFYLLLWKIDMIQKYNKYAILMLKIYGISLCILPFFPSTPTVADRVMEFYEIVTIILYPLLIYIIKPVQYSKILILSMGLYIFIHFSRYLLLWN